MQLCKEHRKQVEEIISVMKCPRDFACYKSGFENLSRVRIIGYAKLVECLEKSPQTCEFGFSFEHGRFCKCPLRYYIAKNFHR